MFFWHVGKRFKQHLGWKTAQDCRAFGNRRQIPWHTCQNLGNAEQFAAPELPLYSMAIKVQHLDDSGFNKKKMRRHLVGPKQGLAMEK